MCIFSGHVDDVSDTQIFARLADERQFLVYSMAYASPAAVAMILPLPVRKGTGEAAVAFISLKAYPDFFADLSSAFVLRSLSFDDEIMLGGGSEHITLVVHDVGDFEASFVPTIGDFDRLDSRFRLPRHLWQHLPRYRDWGFAVFKLKATALQESVRMKELFGAPS